METAMYEIKITEYNDEIKKDVRYVRNKVFIEEQDISYSTDCDGNDEDAKHCLLYHEGNIVATGRILESGQIGRLCVLKEYRKKGAGKTLLSSLIDTASTNGLEKVYATPKEENSNFYLKNGFLNTGSLKEEGINRDYMEKFLI